jgi:hypothetical protein
MEPFSQTISVPHREQFIVIKEKLHKTIYIGVLIDKNAKM